MNKKKTIVRQKMDNWRTIISFFKKYNGKAVIGLFLLSIMYALVNLAFIYMLSCFVNVVIDSLQGEFNDIYWMLGGILAVSLASVLFAVAKGSLTRKVIADSTGRIQEEAILFSGSDDYLHFISKEQKDKHLFLMNVSNSTNQAILNGIMEVVNGVSTILGGVIILFTISGWWSVILAFAMVLICLLVENNNGRKLMELFGNTITESRKLNYYSELLTGSGYAYEKALFGYSDKVHEQMKEVNDEIVAKKSETTSNISRNTMFFRMIYSMIYVGFVLCVFLSGNIKDAGTILLAFNMTKNIVTTATSVGSSLSNMYMQSMYIEKFKEYLTKGTVSRTCKSEDHSMDQGTGRAILDENAVIRVKNLTFRYYENVPILKQVTFSIEKGETVAIVGENGAGKTTLANILLGLLNSEGSVLVNGVDPYEDMCLQKTGKEIVSVMQNFGRYNGISLKDNVTFGKELPKELKKKIGEIFEDENSDQLIDKVMGNEFGGIGASGGQWQKLALMRAAMGQKIVLLDEPTASLDPISEVNVLRDFMNNKQEGSTKLIITHRLGCTKYADRILVLDHGMIVENGGFDELFLKKGKFYEMYTAQADLYKV